VALGGRELLDEQIAGLNSLEGEIEFTLKMTVEVVRGNQTFE
jgi:hypothetical protein